MVDEPYSVTRRRRIDAQNARVKARATRKGIPWNDLTQECWIEPSTATHTDADAGDSERT